MLRPLQLQRSAFPRLPVVFTMLLWGLSASAQQTYTVFPAKPVESRTVAQQPMQHRVTLIVSDSTVKYVVNTLVRQGLAPSELRRRSYTHEASDNPRRQCGRHGGARDCVEGTTWPGGEASTRWDDGQCCVSALAGKVIQPHAGR